MARDIKLALAIHRLSWRIASRAVNERPGLEALASATEICGFCP